jgi:integrase-like protein
MALSLAPSNATWHTSACWDAAFTPKKEHCACSIVFLSGEGSERWMRLRPNCWRPSSPPDPERGQEAITICSAWCGGCSIGLSHRVIWRARQCGSGRGARPHGAFHSCSTLSRRAGYSMLPDTSNAPLRGHTYRTMFALLYGLGLRVGEVSRLCGGDVDLNRQLLVIRDTKFSKSRLVPFGPRIGQLLEDYLARRTVRRGPCSPEALLFSFDGSKAIRLTAIAGTFHRLFDQLKLPIPPGSSRPRVHDLRHSFAVGTLLRWYREGIDPSTRLLHLSTFLGHADPASTAVYLTITPELLAQASWRFERFAGEKLREVLG